MDRNASSSEPRPRLSRSPTPHNLADDDSVSPFVLEQQPHPPLISLDISMDTNTLAESATIGTAAAAAPDGLPVISPRKGRASAPESKLPDATNSRAGAQISSAAPPLSDRLRLFASLSRMSAEEIEVARQTEANTLNNHRFTAPTESERVATSATCVTGKRKSNSSSSSQSSPFLSFSTPKSAPSPPLPTPTGDITDNDTPASPSYLADDETEGDEDSYSSDVSFTGSPHPSSSSQVSGATRNRQKRRRLDEAKTLETSKHTGDQLPKSPSGIIHHQTASRRHQKGYSSSLRAKKTVRFDESRNTVLDYDSTSTIALSDEDVYRMIHSGATSPPRSASNRNPRSSVSLLDHGLMRSPWSAWSAELNKASRPISSDTAPITAHSSRSSASVTTGSSSVDKKEEGSQSPANSSQAKAAGLAQLWSPPRLRLSFSDISSANSATIAASRAAASPSTPPLEEGSSPDPALWSSTPSSPIAPRMPVLQRYATLPASSAPSIGSSDARLLLQYEGLSTGFSEEMDENRQDENTSGDQKDGHLSSSEHSLLARFHRARLTSPSRRVPMRGGIPNTLGVETGPHPYRRSGPNAPGCVAHGAPSRLVRSASLSTPDLTRTPSLRREASSTSLLDILS